MKQIKDILGYEPPPTAALNTLATHQDPPSQPSALSAQSPDIEITPEYEKTLDLIDAKAPVVFVTGRAGTGKSTFIEVVRKRYEGVMAVVAPTGVAALNAGGATIHSFFRFPPRIINPEDIKRVVDSRLYKRLEFLVVDEVSMVRADVIDAMDHFLRKNGNSPNSPFGGTRLVLVGDLAQLPPVVSTEEEAVLFSRRYKSPFFFSAESLARSIIAPVELSRVFRQADASFIDILSRIRLGEASQDDFDALNSRVDQPLPTPAPIILTPTNAAADRINLEGLGRLPGAEKLFIGAIKGGFNLEDKKLPAPLHLKLKPGAHVMFTQNDSAKRWVNGTLGVVTEIFPDRISVEIAERGRGVVDVGRARWNHYKIRYDSAENRVKSETVGEYIQFPLQLAWAVTIHKAQGKTLQAVQVDLGRGGFAPGQTYVALSRARSLETIWLTKPIRSRDVFCDPRIAEFYRALFNRK